VDDDFADGLTDGPVREGRREGRSRQERAGKRAIINHFWQLKDVVREIWMGDAAIMQRMQPEEFLWLDSLRSRKRGSNRFWGAGLIVTTTATRKKTGKSQPAEIRPFKSTSHKFV
jgi:hypothetical protein